MSTTTQWRACAERDNEGDWGPWIGRWRTYEAALRQAKGWRDHDEDENILDLWIESNDGQRQDLVVEGS